MSDIVSLIKTAAMQAVEQSVPMGFCTGKVISENPLQVDINEKFPLTEHHLIKTSSVSDYKLAASFSFSTSSEKEHSHVCEGEHEIVIHNHLKVGEKVLLLRAPGGQSYIIIDRVVE